MNRFLFPLFFLSLIVLTGCTTRSPLEPDYEQVVIRGYLYSGEPVSDIQVTGTLPLGSQDSLAPPINDAEVTLVKNSVQYKLLPSAGDSGYYHYTGTDLTIEPGNEFRIQVSCFGRVATGGTTVPAVPQNVKLSADVLTISASSFPLHPGSLDSLSRLDLSWDQEADALYYVTIENVAENPEPIENFTKFRGKGPQRFISVPRSTNEFQISRFNVTHYGRHIIKVYRVNQEYADLYISRQQDSRDLNEPLSNIRNGLGVFSAFSSVGKVFYVKKE
ncbi:MAG TPA: DUF4249 family protein [Bacteroidetes bacterium]|nr:DUF4249 family protein [Bacteroidota bacterium]